MSINVSEAEVRKIFFENYLVERFGYDASSDPGYRNAPAHDFRKTRKGGGFSDIYTFKNKSGEEFILKVLSATRTESEGSIISAYQIMPAIYNEIFTLFYFTRYSEVPLVTELMDYYEYKCPDIYGEYVYFILMPKYNTLGEVFFSDTVSEKNVYNWAKRLLEVLEAIHTPINFKKVYELIIKDGKNKLSFPKEIFKDISDYTGDRILLHKDIKQGNILVTLNGELIFADFGAVNFLDPAKEINLLCPHFVTEGYFAQELNKPYPEIEGCKTNSDIYSLGATLKWLLTEDETCKIKPDCVSDEFWAVIEKMTDEDGYRYDYEAEVLDDLDEISEFISAQPLPAEISMRTRIRLLVAERNVEGLYNVADQYYNADSEKAFNIRFYAYAKVCNNNDNKNRQVYDEALKIIEPLIKEDDKVALWLYYVFVDNSDPTVFTVIEKNKALRYLEASSDMGCYPAKFLYVKKIHRTPETYGKNAQYVIEIFDELLEKEFIPSLRYYRKILTNPHKDSSIYSALSELERTERVERINDILKGKEDSMECLFFDCLW